MRSGALAVALTLGYAIGCVYPGAVPMARAQTVAAARLQTAESVQASALRGLAPRTVVLSNVALGAGTAVVHALIARRPLVPALLGGAAGGGVMAGGMSLGGRRAPALRLAAVQTVAVGASMTHNAGRGAPILSQVTLPLAPLFITFGRRDSSAAPVQVRVSTAGITAAAMHLSGGLGMRVDWRESAASGGLVFRTADPSFDGGVQCPPGHQCSRAGNQRWGVVAYREGVSSADAVQATLRHESMHVAQRARDAVLFGVPASDALAKRFGNRGRAFSRFLVLDVVMPLRAVDMVTARFAGSSYMSWYEREARAFAPGSAASFLQGGPAPDAPGGR